jgi:hypothetical protein
MTIQDDAIQIARKNDHWIDLAAAHGATKWVQRFIRSLLPQLKDQQISAESFAHSLDEELQIERGASN